MGAPKKKGPGGKKKPARAPQQARAASARAGMAAPAAAIDLLASTTHAPWLPFTARGSYACADCRRWPPLPWHRLQLTAEEHFENAEMAFAMENFELARTSFKRALDMEPEVC